MGKYTVSHGLRAKRAIVLLFASHLDAQACRFAEEQRLERFHGQLMLTPKDIDQLIEQDAEIISAAIAMTAHPAAGRANYHDFIR